MIGNDMSWKSGCAVAASNLAVIVAVAVNHDAVIERAWAGPPATKATSSVSPTARKRAQERFAQARQLYKSGKYRASIEELHAAIELDPEGAEMIYNLGLLHEKLVEVDDAIAAYRHYVEMIDGAEEKRRIEGIIQRLEGARAEIAPPKASASASSSEPQQPAPAPIAPAASSAPVEHVVRLTYGRLDGWVIASGAVAAAGLAIGITFGVKAMSDRVQSVPTTGDGPGDRYEDLQDRKDRSQREAMIADIGFGLAIASGVAAAVLYFARDGEPIDDTVSSATRLSPHVAILPGGGLAGLGVGF
jgi:tetratricopeptide (TPR) repeat protein